MLHAGEEAANAPLEASPAPTPHTSPAKAGRPCKRPRLTIAPTMPDAVNEELTEAQEWLSKQMARLRRALVLNEIAVLLPGPPGCEDNYDENAIHFPRLRARHWRVRQAQALAGLPSGMRFLDYGSNKEGSGPPRTGPSSSRSCST